MTTGLLVNDHDKHHIFFLLLSTSFASICLETVGIYSFSINVGYIYFHVSLLTSILLLSAAISCTVTHYLFLKAKREHRIIENYIKRFFIYSESTLILTILLFFLLKGRFVNLSIAYYALLSVTGAVLGAQFSFAATSVVRNDTIKTDSSYVYTADLLGAGIFLLVLFRYFPVIGADGVLYIALFVKVVSLIKYLVEWKYDIGEEAYLELPAADIKRSALHFIIPFVYGLSVVVTQSLLIRMMLINVGHSHISFGAPIGIWLTGAALGSYFTGRLDLFKKDWAAFTIIALSSVAVPSFVFKFLYNAWEFKSVAFNITFFIIIIAFVSFVSGIIFPMICHYFKDRSFVKWTYILEGVGFFAGGVLFAFFNFMFSDFTMSLISALLLIFLTMLLSVYNKRTYLIVASSVVIIIFGVLFGLHKKLDTEWMLSQEARRGEKLLFYKYTKSGRVEVVLENNTNNIAVYIDRVLQYSLADDKIHNESMAIISYYFTKFPSNVLVIGGGVGGLARELLKFDEAEANSFGKYLKSVDYIEIEPSFKKIREKYFSDVIGDITADKRLNLINDDGFRFLKESEEKYDMIILDLPSPSTLQLARFFTKDFFKIVKDRLHPGGTFMLPLMDPLTFPGELYVDLSVHNTLKNEFEYMRTLLPFYYRQTVSGITNEPGIIKKPYFELVICSDYPYIADIDSETFYEKVSTNTNLSQSPYGQSSYIDILFKASKEYYDIVYKKQDYNEISSLNRVLPLHLKWAHSTKKMNENVRIDVDFNKKKVSILTD
jgi:spermidine synthase